MWSRLWLGRLNNKPSGGCANPIHHLFIPQPIQFLPTLLFHAASLKSARFDHCSNMGWSCGRFPNPPHTPFPHTHTHLSRAKFHQEALLAWLTHSHCCPASPGMFPFPSGPLRWGPGGAGGAFLDQPPYSEPTHPGYLPAMWRACWKRGKAVQRKGEPCALAMLISLVRPWLNPVGICHCCQETRRSLFIIKGFALL